MRLTRVRHCKPDMQRIGIYARSSGFAYIALLILLAIVGLAAAATVQVGSIAQRRQAEDELLFVGLAFKTAIRSYYEATPVGTPSTAPRRLEDLLKDPRFPYPKRYLRQIYIDPLTGTRNWGLIKSGDGGVLGVYSLSKATPIRIANFPDEFFHFAGKTKYSDWVFVYGVVCTDQGCELPDQGGQTATSEGTGQDSSQQNNK
ncbi:MAG TPA: type II secretion system protein [Rhodocyclaceae bacterium]|nr:type II secretion system protein [Rhodocyclaceae bacterium]